MLSDREAGKEDSHFASDANGDDAKMLLLSPPTQIDGGPTNEQRLLLSSSPAVRLRHPGADESISSSPSRRPAGAGAEQRASYGGRPPAVGVSAMCMAGGPAQVWSSEPAAVARRDGGSMELRLRRRSPPALSLSLSLLAAPWRPRHWRMASLGAHGAHTPLGVSSDSGVGRRGHEAEEETAGGLLLVASKSYLP
jgi:hypothetical protein